MKTVSHSLSEVKDQECPFCHHWDYPTLVDAMERMGVNLCISHMNISQHMMYCGCCREVSLPSTRFVLYAMLSRYSFTMPIWIIISACDKCCKPWIRPSVSYLVVPLIN